MTHDSLTHLTHKTLGLALHAPNSLAIDAACVEVHFSLTYKARKKGKEPLFLIRELTKLIGENKQDNTGFLCPRQSAMYPVFLKGKI